MEKEWERERVKILKLYKVYLHKGKFKEIALSSCIKNLTV